MSHKKIIGILLSLSVIGTGIGYVFSEQENYNLCRDGYDYYYGEEGNLNNPPSIGCMDPLGETLGQPLGLGSIALTIIFSLLLFLPQSYFKAWLKYAAWFIPVGIILIVSFNVNCSGGLGLGLCFDKELATWWASGIYILISLGVILATYIRQRRGAAGK